MKQTIDLRKNVFVSDINVLNADYIYHVNEAK
jgi:hypothetical protein